MDYFKRVQKWTNTGFWINNVTEQQAHLAIEAGCTGCTQNPSYPEKILKSAEMGEEAALIMREIMKDEPDDEEVLRELQIRLIGKIAKIFLPMFEQTKGDAGYVTIQASPLHEDYETILKCAKRHQLEGKNIMMKIPATAAGLQAIEKLVMQGFPVLATEVMSVSQAVDVCEIYKRAEEALGKEPVLYFAHIAGIFDEEQQAQVKENGIDIAPDALYQAGILVAKKIAQIMEERGYHAKMVSGGARGLHHFTEMVGSNASVTINWAGTADKLLEADGVVIDRFSAKPMPGIVDELLHKLPDFPKAYQENRLTPEEYETFPGVVRFRTSFENSWRKALAIIAENR
ncbi:MAG: hypothetical protein J5898_04765 [Lachnospiraceae bacterium]|nr:hypothetical protein [Lachnospiraceae bacterium]